MWRRGILMFPGEDDVADVTRVNENSVVEQNFQNSHDTLVMGKGVEKTEFLNVNVELPEGLGSVLFANKDPFSTDSGIGMGTRFKKLMLLCDTEHLLT
jgi:hypothetical protein